MRVFAALTAAVLLAVPARAQQTIGPDATTGVYVSAADVAAAVATLPKDPLASVPLFKIGPYNVNIETTGAVQGSRAARPRRCRRATS